LSFSGLNISGTEGERLRRTEDYHLWSGQSRRYRSSAVQALVNTDPESMSSTSRDWWIIGAVTGCIPALLLADVGATPVMQRVIGGLTWLLLIALLHRETPATRAQVAVAVAFATVAELTGSALLHVYTYRLGNIPAYVFPGHGLIYLAALAFGRSGFAERHVARIRWAALVPSFAWAMWGAFFAARPDYLGAALFIMFAACMFAWRSPAVYAAAFALTTQLELLGVALGNWTWAEQAGWFSSGNPPSAVVAGYCVIDWVALMAGGSVLQYVRNFGSALTPSRSAGASTRVLTP
jgi:hypothetical protein